MAAKRHDGAAAGPCHDRDDSSRAGSSQRTILMAHPSADLYGSDRVLLESVSALAASGRRVIVTLPASGPLVDLLRERGASVELCPSPVLRKSALRPAGMARLVWEVIGGAFRGAALIRRESPSVIYVNTVTIPMWLVLARLFRVPVLCHVHEGEGTAPAVIRGMLALPLLLATRVIANSRFSAEVLARSFPKLGRATRVVYNGVPGPSEPRPARASLDTPLRITYLGRLSPRKGVDIAVSAVALLREHGTEARLDLFGSVFPGYEWYEDQLRAQVAREGLDDVVHFHGFQNPVWEGIASGDVVVVPSRADEPFGNTAIEAILSGRPVLASATSGLLEATEDFRSAQRVAAGSSGALADALRDTVRDWSRLREDAWSDLDVARTRHSPFEYGRHIVDHIESIDCRTS